MVLVDDIAQAMKSLVACVDKKSSLAAEKSLLIEADGQQMTIRAASSKGSLLLTIDSSSQFDPIGVPFAALEKAIKAATEPEMAVNLVQDKLVLETGRRTVRLRTIAAGNFSSDLDASLFSPYATVAGDRLASVLLRAVRIASSEGGTLGAISIEGSNAKLKIAATDRLRLFFSPIPAKSQDSDQLLINRNSCKLLAGAIKTGEDITIQKSDEAVRFLYGDNVWTLPRLHGSFPRFDELIPQEGDSLIIDPEQLANALAGVAAVARSGSLDPNSHIPIRLYLSEQGAKLKYKDSQLGEMEEELPDVYLDNGPDREFGFNGAFLADMLFVLANPQGLLTEESSPVLFEDDKEKYLLMPVVLPGAGKNDTD